MKAKKKNRFLTFCFSLLPGAAEMYMGFMKTGISLMCLFILVIGLGNWMNLEFLPLFGLVIWCYSFFHANHVASLTDEEFEQVEDEYLFGMNTFLEGRSLISRYQKWIAWGLIFIGICFLWNSAADLVYDLAPEGYRFIAQIMWRVGDYIPSIAAGMVILAIGIKLIAGKKMQLADALTEEEKNEQEEQ